MMAPKSAARIVGTLLEDEDEADDVLDDEEGDEDGLRGDGSVSALGGSIRTRRDVHFEPGGARRARALARLR